MKLTKQTTGQRQELSQSQREKLLLIEEVIAIYKREFGDRWDSRYAETVLITGI